MPCDGGGGGSGGGGAGGSSDGGGSSGGSENGGNVGPTICDSDGNCTIIVYVYENPIFTNWNWDSYWAWLYSVGDYYSSTNAWASPQLAHGYAGAIAPNNALAYVSKRASCAGQALMQNKLQTGLDALGLIPGEATIVKSVQIVGAVGAGAYSAYQQNMAGTGLSGAGLFLSILNAEKGTLGKNLAEAVPIAGMVVSAGAVGYDVFGSAEYKACMNGGS